MEGKLDKIRAAFAGRKALLAAGISSFVLSLIIRIDTALIRAVFGIAESYEPLIEKLAASFGALGGILVAAYYAAGFIQERREQKKETPDET